MIERWFSISPKLDSARVGYRIDDIEILRGIAVLYIVVHHSTNLFWKIKLAPADNVFFRFYSGDSSLELFFAISGLVIASSLMPMLARADNWSDHLKTSVAFWIRRFWRLVPSAWFWLMIVMLASVFFNTTGAFGSVRANFEGTIAAVLQVANLHWVMTYGVPGQETANFPYWSLSLEEQFYMLFPFILLLSRRWLPYLLVPIILIQLLSPRSPENMIWLMLRTDGFFLGVLIALWRTTPSYRLFEPRFLRTSAVARWVTFGILFAVIAINGGQLRIIDPDYRVSLGTIIAVILVFIASYDNNYLFNNSPVKSIFMWLGTRSYGIYLTHIPSFFMAREIWYRLAPHVPMYADYTYELLALTAITLIVCFSEFSFRVIEVPLRERGKIMARQYLNRNPLSVEKSLQTG